MQKRNLKFINDPGHAWLSVSLDDIATLDIADKISPYSYISPRRAYLEEDCDAGIFMDAAKAAGWEITITETYNDNGWKGRNWPSYKRYFVFNRFKPGMRAAIADGSKGTVTDGNHLKMDDGRIFRLRRSNPLIGILPAS